MNNCLVSFTYDKCIDVMVGLWLTLKNDCFICCGFLVAGKIITSASGAINQLQNDLVSNIPTYLPVVRTITVVSLVTEDFPFLQVLVSKMSIRVNHLMWNNFTTDWFLSM